MRRDMVAGLIIEDKRLLMVHNIKHGLRVEPPGGKKRDSETWEYATIREIREELGIDVELTGGYIEEDTESPEGPFHLRMYFARRADGQEPRSQEPEKIGKHEWCSFGDLEVYRNSGHLVPNMVQALPKLRPYLTGN